MTKFTAIIIAKNEADRIGRCINSLSIADEIIVLDSGSTDQTREIATEAGATVHSVDWLGYGQTKNLGNSMASNEWIISLDADEYLSSELQKEISNTTFQKGKIYQLNRLNFYLGTPIIHSGWSPDWVYRIFHRDEAQWNDNKVHERLVYDQPIKIERLINQLHHHSYRSEKEHQKTSDKYALLKAEAWIENGKSPGLLKTFFGAGFKVFQSFILRLGFLDGKNGWKIAKMKAYTSRREIYHYNRLKNN